MSGLPRTVGGPSRRELLASGMAAATATAVPAATVAARLPVTDTHVHLFNTADLPIAGFLKHVFYAGHFGPPPAWAAALIDLFGGLLKSLARSAADEGSPALAEAEMSTTSFAQRVAAHVRERSLPGPDKALDPLAPSYRALATQLMMETGAGVPDKSRGPGGPDPLANAIETAAIRSAQDDEPPAGGAKSMTALALPLAGAARMIGWGYVLTQSRRSHLKRYLARFGSDDRAPRRLAALLVDYDAWLDDKPKAGSSHPEQIALMARISRSASPGIGIAVFAGLCPLKLAIETAGRRPRLFDRIKEAHARGDVQGFKLYPPMGFRALGNAELADAEFNPGFKGSALDQWRLVSAGHLGPALDAALEEVYAHAEAAGIPIVAHAGPGNAAGPGYGERANPTFWERVVARYRIRLSLGHLVNEADPFIRAPDRPPFPDNVWALHGSLRMLDRRPANAPDVYGDLAYMPELIDAPSLAELFFRKLRDVFGPGDPDLTRILYGTDWIMLGRERHDSRFLAAVERGMRDARYSARQIENILVANGERFLAAPPPVPAAP